MALVNNRKGVGGRKPTYIPNPFVTDDENQLFGEEYIDQNIDDIINGCVRTDSANRDDPKNRVVAFRILAIYKNVSDISRQSVQDYMRCSRKQAEVYIQVIKDCNFWIARHLAPLGGVYIPPKSGHNAVYLRYRDIQETSLRHYMASKKRACAA